MGDAARKDTACQFRYFVCRYCRGIALVLATQSVPYRSVSFLDSTPDGAEDGGGRLKVEEDSRHPKRPASQQTDELAFRYCRSDHHPWEVSDTDAVDRGLQYEIGVVYDK